MRNNKGAFQRTGEISREPSQCAEWLETFAERLAINEQVAKRGGEEQQTKQVKTAKTAVEVARERQQQRQPSIYEMMSSIISGKKPKYSSVEEAVKDYQQRTGLAQFLESKAEGGKDELAGIAEQIVQAGDEDYARDPGPVSQDLVDFVKEALDVFYDAYQFIVGIKDRMAVDSKVTRQLLANGRKLNQDMNNYAQRLYDTSASSVGLKSLLVESGEMGEIDILEDIVDAGDLGYYTLQNLGAMAKQPSMSGDKFSEVFKKFHDALRTVTQKAAPLLGEKKDERSEEMPLEEMEQRLEPPMPPEMPAMETEEPVPVAAKLLALLMKTAEEKPPNWAKCMYCGGDYPDTQIGEDQWAHKACLPPSDGVNPQGITAAKLRALLMKTAVEPITEWGGIGPRGMQMLEDAPAKIRRILKYEHDNDMDKAIQIWEVTEGEGPMVFDPYEGGSMEIPNGWYWSNLNEIQVDMGRYDGGIKDILRGPFDTEEEAHQNAQAWWDEGEDEGEAKDEPESGKKSKKEKEEKKEDVWAKVVELFGDDGDEPPSGGGTSSGETLFELPLEEEEEEEEWAATDDEDEDNPESMAADFDAGELLNEFGDGNWRTFPVENLFEMILRAKKILEAEPKHYREDLLSIISTLAKHIPMTIGDEVGLKAIAQERTYEAPPFLPKVTTTAIPEGGPGILGSSHRSRPPKPKEDLGGAEAAAQQAEQTRQQEMAAAEATARGRLDSFIWDTMSTDDNAAMEDFPSEEEFEKVWTGRGESEETARRLQKRREHRERMRPWKPKSLIGPKHLSEEEWKEERKEEPLFDKARAVKRRERAEAPSFEEALARIRGRGKGEGEESLVEIMEPGEEEKAAADDEPEKLTLTDLDEFGFFDEQKAEAILNGSEEEQIEFLKGVLSEEPGDIDDDHDIILTLLIHRGASERVRRAAKKIEDMYGLDYPTEAEYLEEYTPREDYEPPEPRQRMPLEWEEVEKASDYKPGPLQAFATLLRKKV